MPLHLSVYVGLTYLFSPYNFLLNKFSIVRTIITEYTDFYNFQTMQNDPHCQMSLCPYDNYVDFQIKNA